MDTFMSVAHLILLAEEAFVGSVLAPIVVFGATTSAASARNILSVFRSLSTSFPPGTKLPASPS